jgi:NAD(P)-dependent dehydrogenase (short-subunit alcohol dehydrogenase family)
MSHEPKIVVITGANSGIGKAAAVRFARAGHRVILACRDAGRGERARREVGEASRGGEVEVRGVDVSSLASVRRFCEGFAERYGRLDVLIHNAGYFNHGIRTYQRSADGLERTFATNVFGPLLLTELLLEALSRSADPRVITAGSTNLKHFFDPRRAIEFDNLRGEHAGSRPYTVYKMYGDSKMGLLLLTRRMAEEYRDRGIKVNCVMIPTVRVERETLRKFSSWFRIVGPLVQYWNPFALSREAMAETYFHLATSDEFREVSGALVDHRHRILPPLPGDRRLTPVEVLRELVATRHAPAYAGDPANVERMWALAREVCGLEERPVRVAGA